MQLRFTVSKCIGTARLSRKSVPDQTVGLFANSSEAFYQPYMVSKYKANKVPSAWNCSRNLSESEINEHKHWRLRRVSHIGQKKLDNSCFTKLHKVSNAGIM